MKARLRQVAMRLNTSYWFVPAVMTFAAFVLSFVTYVIDVKLGRDWISGVWWFHASQPDGARTILSTIASGMISIAGTVFAITIAAVVYASGSYGPRLLTNFMTDRGNQLSLGTFIATFVYTLMVLRVIRQPDEAGGGGVGFVPELSVMISIVMSLIAVGVLVYFLHHVPDSIRITNVIAGVGERAMREVDSRYPDRFDGQTTPETPERAGRPLAARRCGYIEITDFASLREVARAHNLTLHLGVRTGDFVHPDIPLLFVDGDAEGIDRRLRGAFAMGSTRSATQDLEYSIDQLVEIALRALSPAVNDAFTAITCLHWLGAVTAQLAHRDLARDPDGGRYGDDGVYAVIDQFDHFVARGFGSVRDCAAANVIVARIFFEAVQSCVIGCRDAERRALLRREADLLMAQTRLALSGPALDAVEERYGEFGGACG